MNGPVNARKANASAIKAELNTTRSIKEEQKTGLNTRDDSPLVKREDAGVSLSTSRSSLTPTIFTEEIISNNSESDNEA
ncbi:hypothetical protein F2Q69_00039802 [Brassica cretica]|uniref:Uncharacterized protein n=1 Tax=Brassica cretica TaxID=69181 RepID=A0A8S9N5M5_BRACR|nr:hypothetical protein F2Q69_00039802 [Brassica cretica]